jgi:hypothetical protein
LFIIIIKARQLILAGRLNSRIKLELEAKAKENRKRRSKHPGRAESGVQLPENPFWKDLAGKPAAVVLLLFIVIVPTVYYISYIPFLHTFGYDNPFSPDAIEAAARAQYDMFDYHYKLTATHPFSSQWWGWPFDFKPIWIYQSPNAAPDMNGIIVSLGNPLIWLFCLTALVVVFYRLIRHKKLSLLHFVLIGFSALYVSWALVSRISFLYHFYPVLPFYYLLGAFVLEPLWETGKGGKAAVITFGVLCIVCFALFYPALTGIEVPQGYIDNFLRLFPADWQF